MLDRQAKAEKSFIDLVLATVGRNYSLLAVGLDLSAVFACELQFNTRVIFRVSGVFGMWRKGE